MRYIIAAATALALVVGIAIGFALTATVFEAEAKPPPEVQPVEEQNVDARGFVAVHEQGVADVNVVSLPSLDLGPLEFTHVQARTCTNSPTGFCVLGATDSVDVDGILTSLSSQGWRLVETNSGTASSSSLLVLYTLSRPVP